MTEKKTELVLLNWSSGLSCEQLFTSAYPLFDPSSKGNLDDSIMHSMYELFNSKLASQHFTPYLVGQERVKVYGNPMVMRAHSGYWRNIREMNDFVSEVKDLKGAEETEYGLRHVAPHILVTEFPTQFVDCWCYMNGVTTQPYEYESISDLSLPEIFKSLQLSDYFQTVSDIQTDSLIQIGNITKNWRSLDLERIELINRLSTWSAKLHNTGFKNVCANLLRLPFHSEKVSSDGQAVEKKKN